MLTRHCFWFAQYIGFQTEVCVLTGCIKTLEEVPERTRFKGKQCPVPLLPYGLFCIIELPEILLLLRAAAGMDLVSLISFDSHGTSTSWNKGIPPPQSEA